MERAAGWPQGRLGRLVASVLGFVLLAPAGLVALPAAALSVGRPSRGGWRTVLLGAIGGVGVVWIYLGGDLPDQTAKAATLMGTVAFVILSERTSWSVTTRALLSAAIAAIGTAALYTALGWSWERLHWWVTYRTSFTLRLAFGGLGASAFPGAAPDELAQSLDRIVRWMADAFPAITAIQWLLGCGLAVAIHGRIAARPRGAPPARIRDFRFSEHLGWLLVLGLAGVLLAPAATPLRLVAINFLTLGAALYLARGLAVMAFLWTRVRAAGWLVTLLAVAMIVLLMPVVLGALLALGVLDAGLDLRRRLAVPPPTQ